ncbi:VOC family protein [Paenibacillus mendelii]|uniref:VOC family protein n=1 Tax=Paenibacillus mendelii TaxID=206163 RepID=A0ABV6JGC0_9BACL|nr:VOC family protein [Paenibacillus mendelii]MCQ6557359.1 VOC family protein [Paenibacillus mendelii]
MNKSARWIGDENFKPNYVTNALKVIKGHEGVSSEPGHNQPASLSNGLESGIDRMTLVQLPASDLRRAVAFYVEVVGMGLEYPERPIESHAFLQTVPRIGPGLHILETPDSEFRHLHGSVNGVLEEYAALYIQSLDRLRSRLQQAGAEIVTEPEAGYMSFFDPEGHLIGAYERSDSEMKDRFESNMTGFRHVQMHVRDPLEAAAFHEDALGFARVASHMDAIYMQVNSGEVNQPMIRLVQAADPDHPLFMHWMLDGQPKHALELHSKNIGALKEQVIARGGSMKEELEFTGCGGYLKLYTPDGHYIWVNQDRSYCDY